MGGQLSKPPRSLPKINQSASRTPSFSPPNISRAGVSFEKSDVIRQDGIDQQLGQMLKKMSPVEVPKLSTNFQPTDNMLKILESRRKDFAAVDNHPSQRDSNLKDNSTTDEIRLKLSTISQLINRHHSNPTGADRTGSNFSSDQREQQTPLESVDDRTHNYLIQHFNTIDNIQLFQNPNPNQSDQPIKMAVWFQSPDKPKPN